MPKIVLEMDHTETLMEVSRSTDSYLSRFECDAAVAREALHRNNNGGGVDYKALIEIFTCRKSSHVLRILEAYLSKYSLPLELEISSIEPLHPCQKMLIALSASHKAHQDNISTHIAKCDAKRLYQTGEGKVGSIDQCVVLEMFSKRSIAQLKLTFFSYKHIYGHTYTSFLKKEELGDFEDTLRVVAKCICNPPKYYAKTLYECLKGRRTDQGALVRIMVSRAEVDMDDIRTIFMKKFNIDLKDAIFESIPDGDHRNFLVALASKDSNFKPTCS